MATTQHPPKKKEVNVPLPAKLVVGGVAGVIGTSVIFPIDMVKTRLQNQSVTKAGERMYTGAWDCFTKIIRNEGVKGLYRGLAPNLVGVTPEKAIKLAVNDEMRRKLENDDGSITLLNEIIAGATAGFCQVSVTNPMELVKIRLQLQAVSGVKKSAVQVVRELGFRGMYTGVLVTFLRDIPFSIIFFPLYANLKEWFKDQHGDLSLPRLFLSSFIAGGVAAASVTPADVVKTRIQAESGKQYKNIPDCFYQVYTKEGVGAFFKGAPQRVVVMAPLFGIALLAFELQKWWIQAQMEARNNKK